ncbi:MAG: hypothetical protein J2O39_06280 [Acidimicrobiales bacterium]|nr:hypothetical protein [Acidimicrobiales bacterium]
MAEDVLRRRWDRQAAVAERREPDQSVELAWVAAIDFGRDYLRPVLNRHPGPEASAVAAAFEALERALGRLQASLPY